MQSGVKTLSAGGGASLCCLLLLWLIYSHLLREGQLAVGTCEIVMLNRDSSVPRRTIARQTARCACRRGQIAGTTRARPACVDEAEFHQNNSACAAELSLPPGSESRLAVLCCAGQGRAWHCAQGDRWSYM
ncbi:chemokine-like protein TAFA-3 isoform X2 [Cheilinus undulatus]|uniref:chemokine-like protein TAFA-3 isoform X2 n=1 Tax=Cheilinus undulatus TaxID=241271 RepID=UPI001BD3DDFE|nr:chemokine-like protein TAFA-3 isoform X2 [Cheilinus undulatus]